MRECLGGVAAAGVEPIQRPVNIALGLGSPHRAGQVQGAEQFLGRQRKLSESFEHLA